MMIVTSQMAEIGRLESDIRVSDSVLKKRANFNLPLNYGQKVFLLAALPLVLAVAAIATVVNFQSRALFEQEIAIVEDRLLGAKKSELINYMSLARTSIAHIYGNAAPDDDEAKKQVMQILAALTYGPDGYFFVYDYDGKNLVSPKQTNLIGKNWIDAQDGNGNPVVSQLIDLARQGGGTMHYVWPKPSTGRTADIFSYVVGLQDWQWAVGTGMWVDDVYLDTANLRAAMAQRIGNTFRLIIAITLVALLVVFISVMLLNIRERWLADVKLKKLTQRVIDTQEEERLRVARELHDGISQVLVGIRYTLNLVERRLETGTDGIAEGIKKSALGLNHAIYEVRRISRDLRPGVLDDLGLGPALTTLTDEFRMRTGIETILDTNALQNLLQPDAKTALFRVAQEALTNIERHANASRVDVLLSGGPTGMLLKISDNGSGFGTDHASANLGLGLRNMQERVEHLDGELRIFSNDHGTTIEARLPKHCFIRANDLTPKNLQETA